MPDQKRPETQNLCRGSAGIPDPTVLRAFLRDETGAAQFATIVLGLSVGALVLLTALDLLGVLALPRLAVLALIAIVAVAAIDTWRERRRAAERAARGEFTGVKLSFGEIGGKRRKSPGTDDSPPDAGGDAA
mgnify:CR=1 FL=1